MQKKEEGDNKDLPFIILISKHMNNAYVEMNNQRGT